MVKPATLADWRKMNGKELLSAIHTAFYLSAAYATHYHPEPAKYDHDATALLKVLSDELNLWGSCEIKHLAFGVLSHNSDKFIIGVQHGGTSG